MMGIICWGLLSQPQYFALCCVSGWVRVLLVSSHLTVWTSCLCTPLSVCVLCACWGGTTISPGCSMSFSASRAEVDVLVGQNWRVLLPCVSITRWPLFPCTACQIHPQKKNGLSKRNEQPTSTAVKCTRAKRECGFIRPGKAAGQRLIEVQLFPQTSLTLVNGERKHCWIIYCASVACRMQRGVKIHS